MRIFSNHCRRFEYRVTAASPCAVTLAPSDIGVTRSFFDCLLLTVAVQPGDLALTGDAVGIVKRIAARTGSAYIVIDGFTQWAEALDRRGPAADFDVLTGLADALDVLADLTERLEERGERVHLMPFGWNKIQHAEVTDGRWARYVTDVRHDTHRIPSRTPAWSLTPRVRMPCARTHQL
ncbi:hypothetical protein [Nocardia mexicana]|uniref:Uncharacterized protein n=1 Tax=Nocardia mexicana TaxID=279262 RepID=A0A370HDG3_9NOCA|nr:hypothetical protein [Nocardia mexicana]RDI54455.1 hypothetical protein DFR68_102583 [Nocardia mexicana]